MAHRRRELRPQDYGRCTLCGKLTEKQALSSGPDGAVLGPECLKRAVLLYTERTAKETADGPSA